LDVGILLLHLCQAMLGLLAEMIEVGCGREVARHDSSFVAQCPPTGKKRGPVLG